jgi:1,4-dihydroxy-2-naphthoate octaprenyltransferase
MGVTLGVTLGVALGVAMRVAARVAPVARLGLGAALAGPLRGLLGLLGLFLLQAQQVAAWSNKKKKKNVPECFCKKLHCRQKKGNKRAYAGMNFFFLTPPVNALNSHAGGR